MFEGANVKGDAFALIDVLISVVSLSLTGKVYLRSIGQCQPDSLSISRHFNF